MNEQTAPLDLLTVDDIVKMFRLKRSTVYAMANRGKIPAIKIGSLTRFRTSSLLEWMQDQESKNYGRKS